MPERAAGVDSRTKSIAEWKHWDVKSRSNVVEEMDHSAYLLRIGIASQSSPPAST